MNFNDYHKRIMNINILRYSLFGIAGGQKADLNFS